MITESALLIIGFIAGVFASLGGIVLLGGALLWASKYEAPK